jgi:uncharacterized protein (TIGR00369 family)
MSILSVKPGYAKLTMAVRADMVNGHHICHGGMIFSLADTAFRLFLQQLQQEHRGLGLQHRLSGPGQGRRHPAAEAIEQSQSGRTGVYDVTVRTFQRQDHRPAMTVKKTPARRSRAHRNRQPRRNFGAATAAPEVVAAARLRQRAALPQVPLTTRACTPSDLKTLADLAKFPFMTKQDLRDNYPFGLFAVPRNKGGPPARLQSAPPASRPWSATPATTSTTGPTGGALDPRRRRPRRRHGAQRLRLRHVHRRPRRALRRRAAGLHGDPDVRRADRKAGAADHGLQAGHHHGHALLHRW